MKEKMSCPSLWVDFYVYTSGCAIKATVGCVQSDMIDKSSRKEKITTIESSVERKTIYHKVDQVPQMGYW